MGGGSDAGDDRESGDRSVSVVGVVNLEGVRKKVSFFAILSGIAVETDMNKRTKTGLEILQAAVVIGVLGNLLLRSTPWGINVTLFNLAFAAGMITLLWRNAPEFLTKQTIALFGSLIFFESMFAWRDAIELRAADTIAIVAILSLIFVPRMGVAAKVAGVFQYAISFFWSAANSFFSPFLLVFSDIDWGQTPRSGWMRHLIPVIRGVAIATPLLIIFGALFAAADAIYAGWVERVLNIAPETLVTHVLLTAVFAWLSAGYLRGVMMKETFPFGSDEVTPEVNEGPNRFAQAGASETGPRIPNNVSILEHINISDPPQAEPETKTEPKVETSTTSKPWNWANFDSSLLPNGLTLGTVEIGVLLGLLNLLFLSFVIVQVPYLFGGMELVQNTPDFKLAEYARRGFGELVVVAGLVLPILLVTHWLIRKDSRMAGKLFRVLAGIQIALLFVIMASAVQRLALLTGNLGYGMTTVRLYPLIFMSWLAIVFAWFGATVLRGARQHFAWGAIWAAFLILGATHGLNPDEFIVKTNIALMQQGRDFDAGYNASLSQDAVPELISNLNALSERDQCTVRMVLWGRMSSNQEENTDLRSWNWSRFVARSFLIENSSFHSEASNRMRCSDLLRDGLGDKATDHLLQ